MMSLGCACLVFKEPSAGAICSGGDDPPFGGTIGTVGSAGDVG